MGPQLTPSAAAFSGLDLRSAVDRIHHDDILARGSLSESSPLAKALRGSQETSAALLRFHDAAVNGTATVELIESVREPLLISGPAS